MLGLLHFKNQFMLDPIYRPNLVHVCFFDFISETLEEQTVILKHFVPVLFSDEVAKTI